MNFGSSLFIKLVDKNDHAYYSEPFTITRYGSKFDEALEVFRQNGLDAVRGIIGDIEVNNRLKDLNDNELASALRARGWTVTAP